ncbi:glycosyltransferase family 4 protein [Clostridium perfringens]|uniref:glycosyltransferase family 4 protein n=1 Tax=Clostridium perfringens TaxID=1502 RepID=UPI0024BD4030|nr:glycosyltransferase family 4 protein [Clostridium perfringens]
MRILLINTYYYPEIIGGAEISVKKLAEGLVLKGHDVFVIANGKNKIEEINKVKIYRLPFVKFNNIKVVGNIYRKISSINNIFFKSSLKNLVKEIKPDVIHVNNLYYISPIIWSIGKQINIPIIQTIRDYYLTCPKSTLLCDGEKCNTKMSICKLYNYLNKIKFKDVDIITAPSNFTLNLFKNENLIDEKKSICIYNSIDILKEDEKIISIRKERKNNLNFKLVYLGALVKHKGIRELIDVFNDIKVNNIELHIAGDGEEKDFVEKHSLSDKRIKYHGKLNEKEVQKLLQNSDILIAPSIWYEPFGRVIIDAYKFGLPVIASNLGGLSEIVRNEETGLLINVKNKNEFIEAIYKMLNKEKIFQMSMNSLTFVKNFDISKQIDKFEEVYLALKNKLR